jgi:hypothetical protein
MVSSTRSALSVTHLLGLPFLSKEDRKSTRLNSSHDV